MKLFRNFHHSALLKKSQDHRATQKIVVVADSQSNTCATSGQIHQTGHNLITFRLPVPPTLQTPSVDEIADKIKIFRLMSIEKFQERLDPRVPEAEMKIAQK